MHTKPLYHRVVRYMAFAVTFYGEILYALEQPSYSQLNLILN